MFSSYFNNIQKQLLKIYAKQPKKEGTASTTAKKAAKKDYSAVIDAVNSMTSPDIDVVARKIADKSGYVSDSADFVAVKRIFSACADIFSEAVPSEIAAGAFHIVEEVNHKQLTDVLVKTAMTKKIDHYSENSEETAFIPGFIIALRSTYSLKELKESILEIYEKDAVDPLFEFDIMMVIGKGLIIKNWRDGARSFIALETGEDTMKWFFLLMNEYVEAGVKTDIDLRQYVKETARYSEY